MIFTDILVGHIFSWAIDGEGCTMLRIRSRGLTLCTSQAAWYMLLRTWRILCRLPITRLLAFYPIMATPSCLTLDTHAMALFTTWVIQITVKDPCTSVEELTRAKRQQLQEVTANGRSLSKREFRKKFILSEDKTEREFGSSCSV